MQPLPSNIEFIMLATEMDGFLVPGDIDKPGVKPYVPVRIGAKYIATDGINYYKCLIYYAKPDIVINSTIVQCKIKQRISPSRRLHNMVQQAIAQWRNA